MAALKVLEGGAKPSGERTSGSRWELAGRLGRDLPVGRKLEGSPWAYPRLEVEA
jgi:hypothetical protein